MEVRFNRSIEKLLFTVLRLLGMYIGINLIGKKFIVGEGNKAIAELIDQLFSVEYEDN